MNKYALQGLVTGFLFGNIVLYGFLFPAMGVRTFLSSPWNNNSSKQ